MSRRSMRSPAGQLRRSSSAQHMTSAGQGITNSNYAQGGLGNGYADSPKVQQSRVSHGSLHSQTSLQHGQQVQNMSMGGVGVNSSGSIRQGSIVNQQIGNDGLLASPQSMAAIGKARAMYACELPSDFAPCTLLTLSCRFSVS